jgi:formylglycine-generating enzyme required for sulfatase activity
MPTPLEHELHLARKRTDELFQVVRADSLYERPIPERHRIVFYLGHLEAFDWNLIAGRVLGLPAFHPSFDRLFAFGIDPPEGQLPSDTPEDWPDVEEIRSYNQRVRDAIDSALQSVPEEYVHAAIEHRLMHAETLAYIFHQLPYERKIPMGPILPGGAAVGSPSLEPHSGVSIEIPSGVAELGRAPQEGFGWDNEYEPQSVSVPAFAIGKYKVTNGDYLMFVRQGGATPFFWTERRGQWFYRGMFAETPVPLDHPVYVTKCQAEEYARWRGAGLPTEAQFQLAAAGRMPSQNVDFRYWDPISVTADDDSEGGPAQLTGNGWEWTSTLFGSFPGFQPKPYYTNYSAPFFDGAHYVLKGGSPRTAARLLRPSFRNWFRPSYPYIYATFRLMYS